MRKISIVLLTSLSLATFAAHANQDPHSKTREQVRQELAEAKQNGQYTFGELEQPAAVSGVQSTRLQPNRAAQASFGELDYPG